MGNALPSGFEDGGVEPDRPTLFSYHDPYDSSDDDCEVRLDLESGRGSFTQEVVEVTPEDKALRIYGMLKELHPPDIPICKRMLYFSMIYSEEDISETDVALGSVIAEKGDDMIECYWMFSSHVYVDILKHNESRLGVYPIFESVTAEDLHFVCIQKEHVDSCVDLFWDKFIEMGLDVHQPRFNGTTHPKNQDVDESPPVIMSNQMVDIPLHGTNFAQSSTSFKKNE